MWRRSTPAGLAAALALGLAVTLLPTLACERDEPRTPVEDSSPAHPAPITSNAAPAATGSSPGLSPPADPSLTAPRTQPVTSQPSVPDTAESPDARPLAFHPLADAVTGEWAIYTALDQQTLRYDVTRVSTLDVDTRVTVTHAGRPVGFPATRTDPRNFEAMDLWPPDPIPQRAVRDTTAHAAGRDWSARLIEDRWTDEEIHYVRRTWLSPDVPVFGLIRMELYGNDTLEARLILKEEGGTEGRRDSGTGE